jgi:hypothetical protein
MNTTNCGQFKGEIENYLVNSQNNIDSKTNNLFRSLKLKTWLCRTNLGKKKGIMRLKYEVPFSLLTHNPLLAIVSHLKNKFLSFDR